MPRLYFAGSASHGRDHKRAAGGFIHGFRYTAWSLYHSLEEKYEGQPWPQQTFGVAPESVEQDLLVSAQPLCAPENVPVAAVSLGLVGRRFCRSTCCTESTRPTVRTL